MPESTVRSARRPAKPGGKKTANRFAKLAGGDATPTGDLSPTSHDRSEDGDGLIAGMTAVAADEAHRVVDIPVSQTAPHPFNDTTRSQPQPADPKWVELLNGVRTNGVRLPVLVVPRETFTAARPTAADDIAPDARYVLIYGHRRRIAALEAGRATIPAVIDDAIMADNGDLDAMAAENLGRQDLSDLAEADLYARYSDIGLSQRAIADRLGVDQATVSRRLALQLLTPEVRHAVTDGTLPSAEAAALAGKLPYGPPRRWQKTKDADQDTEQRRTEQLHAQRLILQHNWLASRAAERVIAERDARTEADALGVALIDDPRTELGDDYTSHRITRGAYTSGTDVVGVINANTGYLDLYTRSTPPDEPDDSYDLANSDADPTDHPAPAPLAPRDHAEAHPDATTNTDRALAKQQQADTAAAAAAQALRREACATLIAHPPSNAELLKVLVRQYLSGVAARSQSSTVRALLRDWSATVDGTSEKARHLRAWHHAIAAAEVHTAEQNAPWDDEALAHLDLLTERVGYQPTEWERRQQAAARR